MKNDLCPNAIRSPLLYAGEGDSIARLGRLQSEFAKILAVPRIFVRHQGTEHFISARHDDTLNHSSLDARAGESRYTWKNRGDDVLYGYLKVDG